MLMLVSVEHRTRTGQRETMRPTTNGDDFTWAIHQSPSLLVDRTGRLRFLVDTGAQVSIVLHLPLNGKIDKNIHEMLLITVLLLVSSSLIWVYVAHLRGCLLLPSPHTLSWV